MNEADNMDMIRMQRVEIENLRRDLRAALREIREKEFNLELFSHLTEMAHDDTNNQAIICQRLTACLCEHDMAIEAAEIVGIEAVEKIQATLHHEKCMD